MWDPAALDALYAAGVCSAAGVAALDDADVSALGLPLGDAMRLAAVARGLRQRWGWGCRAGLACRWGWGWGVARLCRSRRHAHVDTTARYIHLAPTHVKAQYDAARTRQRDTNH